jgi:hypothetical protein
LAAFLFGRKTVVCQELLQIAAVMRHININRAILIGAQIIIAPMKVLHESNAIRFGIRPSEFALWLEKRKPMA